MKADRLGFLGLELACWVHRVFLRGAFLVVIFSILWVCCRGVFIKVFFGFEEDG